MGHELAGKNGVRLDLIISTWDLHDLRNKTQSTRHISDIGGLESAS